MLLEVLINRHMNSRKNALKTVTKNYMNELAQKHFKYTDLQKPVRICTMNENQKLFASFLRCTPYLFHPNVISVAYLLNFCV
jgi:hypothetical protein